MAGTLHIYQFNNGSFLGGLAIETIMGIDMIYAIIGLALFAAAYSLYGGLSAVAWTDVIQVVFLVLGGLVTTYIALNTVSDGGGVIAGFNEILKAAPDKFHMVIDQFKADGSTNSNYLDLPGIWVIVGGLWVANLYYWGFNQYIIQRTLAAKSLRESQKGILFAAFLKLIIPLVVVIPGIAAYVMVNDPEIMARLGEAGEYKIPTLEQADRAYPWLLQFLPTGLKGVAFAALSAAIVSSLASMLNSTSTIFTMDIYKEYINKNADDKTTVKVGRITAAVALIIAVLIAPMLDGLDQIFQYIQEYTGMVSPGILAVFLLGLFWKKTTNNAAIWGVLASLAIALFFKFVPISGLEPWMHQMGLTFILTSIIIVVISYMDGKGADSPKGIVLTKELFKTSPLFNIGAFVVMIILVVLYSLFWN